MKPCEWPEGCSVEVSALRGERLCAYHEKRENGTIRDDGLAPTAPTRWPTVESLESERRKRVARRVREFDRLLRQDARGNKGWDDTRMLGAVDISW